METTVLEMFFYDDFGKTVQLTVKEPRTDLIPSEVESTMTTIIGLDIFNVPGPLTLKGAQVVTRSVTDLELE